MDSTNENSVSFPFVPCLLLAIASSGVAATLEFAFAVIGKAQPQFLFLAVAVFVSTYFGGRRAGVLTTLVGAAAAWSLGALAFGAGTSLPLVSPYLPAFIAVGLAIALFVERRPSAPASSSDGSSPDTRKILHEAAAVLWEWNLGTGIVTRSENAPDVLGLPVKGHADQFFNRIHPDDRPHVEESIQHVAALGKGAYSIEFRIEQPGAEPKWVLSRGYVFSDTAGRRHLRGLCIDISDRAAREAANAHLAAVVQHCHEAIISFSTDGRIRTWNPAAERMFGYAAHEVAGKPLAITVPRDKAEESDAMFRRALAGETVAEVETVRLTKSGRRVQVMLSRAPIWKDGKVIGISATVTDITARKQAEERIQKLVLELRHADRRKDELLAMLGHELRNPLAPIKSALEVMGRSCADDPTAEWCTGIIRRQTEHLIHLVNDLLDVSRLTLGKIRFNKRPLDLKEVVDAAIETSRPLIQRAQQKLVVNMSDRTLRVKGDHVRLVQALSNLISNASKYGEERGTIELDVEATGSEVVLQVRDDGRGIQPEVLPHVFDFFTQGDQSFARLKGGLGVGLAVVRMIVEEHGGTAEAESAGPGRGSTFRLRLPLLRECGPSASAGDAGPQSGQRRRTLADGDDRDSADAMGPVVDPLPAKIVRP